MHKLVQVWCVVSGSYTCLVKEQVVELYWRWHWPSYYMLAVSVSLPSPPCFLIFYRKPNKPLIDWLIVPLLSCIPAEHCCYSEPCLRIFPLYRSVTQVKVRNILHIAVILKHPDTRRPYNLLLAPFSVFFSFYLLVMMSHIVVLRITLIRWHIPCSSWHFVT